MGLIASVYKHGKWDASLNGISSTHSDVVIVNADGPFEASEGDPAVRIESHQPGVVRAVPVEPDGEGGWTVKGHAMFGGAYIATSDARFRELVEGLLGHRFYGAVPLHDRFEG